MNNKQLISILNYNAIGEGILNETIGFNQDLYEFVDVKTYSYETIFNMAKDFIENHAEEAVDYIKWCFALMNDCEEKTYDVMFDVVYEHTKAENKNYYWNDYLYAFVPREFLNNALTALEEDTLESYSYEVKNDLGEYISININDDKYKILNDNEKYIFRNEDEDIYYTKNVEELLDYIYKLANKKSYDERILNKYLKNYGFIGRDVLDHEVTNGDSEDSLYWIDIYSLSAETIESIGREFVKFYPKEAEKFAKYVLGMENEYPNIYDFVEGIIQENVLKLEKDYCWNSKLSQVMPRQVLLDLEKYLSSKGVTFIHKTDDGEYIEIPLSNNSSARICGFSYNDIVGESSHYSVDINGEELCLDESEILIHLEEIKGTLSSKDKYTLENATYINHEKNWLLQETRIFDDENNGAMMESYLQVLDMTNNMAQVEDEMLDNDVWSIEWDKINSFTKKINKF